MLPFEGDQDSLSEELENRFDPAVYLEMRENTKRAIYEKKQYLKK